MTTNWSGRLPPSYTITSYDEGLYGDSTTWGGVIINNTAWNGRVIPTAFTPYTWDESTFTWESITFTWDTWGTSGSTQWNGRIIP